MANAALAGINNLFDSAVLTASSAASLTPVSNLQIPHVTSKKWRGTGGATDWVTATWAADQTADTFMINGLPSIFLLTGTVRLQGFNAAAAQVFDTTTQAGIVDPDYGYAIHLLASQTFRSLKWTFTQAGASYIEGGRGFVGLRTQVTYNFAPGESRAWNDLSKVTQSEAGQDFVDDASPGMFRTWDVNFSWIDETQRGALHEQLDIRNGIRKDVLFISDPASTNLGRDSVWGRVVEMSPVTRPFTIGDLYARTMRFKERR